MIKHVDYYLLNKIFSSDGRECTYIVPPYQRQYVWEKRHCQKLFDDIVENDKGYYLDRYLIISVGDCMNPKYHISDGQQRIASLTLLLASLYNVLTGYKSSMVTEQITDYDNLKRQIASRNKIEVDGKNHYIYKPKLILQKENRNNDDYQYILSECGIIDKIDIVPEFYKKRKLYMRFSEFKRNIISYVKEKECSTPAQEINELFNLLDKVNSITMVGIEVDNDKDVYKMFESLNNRGMALSAVDLIKNRIFNSADKGGEFAVKNCYKIWDEMFCNLSNGNDINSIASTGELFFRQFYNAFRFDMEKKLQKKYSNPNISLCDNAVGANILDVYDVIIDGDKGFGYSDVVSMLYNASKVYSAILYCESNKKIIEEYKKKPYYSHLCNLTHLNGRQYYQLVLYVLMKQEELELTDDDITEILRLIIVFCVKRNIMDNPAPRRFKSALYCINQNIEAGNIKKGKDFVEEIRSQLLNQFTIVQATDDVFKKALYGNLYSGSKKTISFILRYLEDYHSTRENKRDIWNEEWTIEHIFPEGENIPQVWVDEIAGGDMTKAQDLLKQKCHCIGNLTLSKFNSNLSNKGYLEKKDKKDSEGKWIGYRNGLYLNSYMASHDKWTEDEIDERTSLLIDDIMNVFKW